MKKIFVLVLAILAVFMLAGMVTACKSPPPPPPPPPPPQPPPEEEPMDPSPPVLTVALLPQPFSPDDDGEDDLLTISIGVETNCPIYMWEIQIREPVSPYRTFYTWTDEGMPPETITWDGRSESGELVQSASDYLFSLTVNNIYNNYTVFEDKIEVDVLVIRDGDLLRVIVPSIVFPSNSSSLSVGLAQEIVEANDAILHRIGEVLNKYSTYKVTVEGHANPTTAPNTKARENEEKGDRKEKGLLPLSEERAKAVMDYLIKLGIAADRLNFIGMGSKRTVAEFTDRDNWWKNRRVEFILEKGADAAEPESEEIEPELAEAESAE